MEFDNNTEKDFFCFVIIFHILPVKHSSTVCIKNYVTCFILLLQNMLFT